MHLVTDNPFSGLEAFVTENVPLARFTWYKIGGPARYLVQPRSIEELQEAARRCTETNIPIYVLGLGANLLVCDQGVDGAVFRLNEEFWRRIKFTGNLLEVGAGTDMQKLLLRTVREGKSGLECLAGIPGTIGGGIRMNCGGKFGDIGSVISTVTVMDSQGNIFVRTKDDLVFDYRRTNIVAPFILGATIELEDDHPDAIMSRTREIWMYKRNTQPLNTKNCGCIFKNPRGLSAGALIDQSGLKGLRVGGAEVSTKHANFIVAHKGCSSQDVLKLIKIIKERVYDKHQVVLESEVRIWPL
ncbi:MAG: UDP-N-acetylenolpyruvoylglucosamine reductase [Phycisphaerae bacterium]|jgi:UDP-N-acetylmuramate dehydrogenase|nr:MAG: UDP-N-acetylenolpyruvoylglucosamine reductase [Phycisphaerae bacterium]